MSEDFFSENIGLEPKINFEDKNNIKVVIKNGSPEMTDKLEAIRQWIVKFCDTEKDAYPIYAGTGFGTRLKSLYGRKRIGYGFEEAEIERDFEEGLLLCPAISEVADFKLSKNGKVLNIALEVQLFNGELVNVDVEKIYVIGG
ncbi:MAG: DUF2634 domain-containing protein [Candidatus Gastranaerophilales bacterium]|nr:DUF2634 domain-containing protein [Candidatus Gastranaerophilales bacterium]